MTRAAAALFIAAAFGAGATARAGAAAPFHCRPTLPSQSPAVGRGPVASTFDYGTTRLRVELYWPRGTLAAGRLPGGGEMAHVNADGSISAKVGWWRSRLQPLRIAGSRLDAPAPPLRAQAGPSASYGGFVPSILTFPTTGCWRVVGTVGDARLAFVVRVTRLHANP